MATTELDDIQALLDRLRPDPSGFAQRLLVQVMARFGDGSGPDPTTFYTETEVVAGEPVEEQPITAADEPASDVPAVDTNMLLAAALGACQCWGLRDDCEVCAGHGCTGWVLPDRELFEELVRPAVTRMAGRPTSRTSATPPDRHGTSPSTEGVDR